jgi:hypothetical protein
MRKKLIGLRGQTYGAICEGYVMRITKKSDPFVIVVTSRLPGFRYRMPNLDGSNL